MFSNLASRLSGLSYKAFVFGLGAICVIERGGETGIETLSPGEALPELLRHSYMAPLVPAMAIEAEHLRRCARIAATVPVRRLRVGEGLDSLIALASMLALDPVLSR